MVCMNPVFAQIERLATQWASLGAIAALTNSLRGLRKMQFYNCTIDGQTRKRLEILNKGMFS